MDHIRRTYDKAYRRIQLYSSATPKFVEFTSDQQLIQYNERDQILEILRDDGSTELFSGNRDRIGVFYCPHGIDQIRIQIQGQSQHLNDITARMWARKGSSGIHYKLPPMARCEGSCAYVMIPGGSAGVELFGDKYFKMAFDLTAR
jgi:hypothetical protein